MQWDITQPKKGQNNVICSNIDGPRDCQLSEVRQMEKDK